MHQLPPPPSIQDKEFHSFLRLLFRNCFPIPTVHIHCNKIICFCVNFLYCIIAARYGEGKWESNLGSFLVGHPQPPLVLVTCHVFLMWLSSYNLQCSPWFVIISTTQFSYSLSTSFRIIPESLLPYLCSLQHMGGWLPL